MREIRKSIRKSNQTSLARTRMEIKKENIDPVGHRKTHPTSERDPSFLVLPWRRPINEEKIMEI